MAIDAIKGLTPMTPSLFQESKLIKMEETGESFSDFLSEALNKVNSLQNESAKITEDFVAGRTDSIHQVQIASEKAEVALQFTMQIRNKILDAYHEIMRVQI
ncbi:MAG: flagellar hook-basal body complex protein FliE [Clostridia bacterium]|nr:flagellar hook-basal body complex protein FliE [Clostridia bacterium]